MTPGMQCLLEVLRGETSRDIPLSEWQDALQVAKQENVQPFFAAKFRQSGATAPAPVLEQIANIESEGVRTGFWLTSELRGVLQAFAKQAIPVLPLKGPFLAERLHGGIQHRLSRDLDLLVHPEDVAAACAALQELGFTESTESRNKYHSGWGRGTTGVELHHDVADRADFKFDTAGAWKRATQTQFLGQPVWQLAPQDELLFLCLHGAKHCFHRLNLVADLVIAFQQLAPQLVSQSDSGWHELDHVLVLGRAMAMRLDPRVNPALQISLSPATTARLERLAAKKWLELVEGRSRSLTPWKVGQFYVEAEPAPARRLLRNARLICFYAVRLTGADFDLAARFGVKRTVPVWVLRQFRLLGSIYKRVVAMR